MPTEAQYQAEAAAIRRWREAAEADVDARASLMEAGSWGGSASEKQRAAARRAADELKAADAAYKQART